MYFYCYDYLFLLDVYVRLPWLRFFHIFSSVVRQCQGKTRKDGARSALFLIFVLFYVLFVLYRSMYCLCVYVYCTTATWWLPNCS